MDDIGAFLLCGTMLEHDTTRFDVGLCNLSYTYVEKLISPVRGRAGGQGSAGPGRRRGLGRIADRFVRTGKVPDLVEDLVRSEVFRQRPSDGAGGADHRHPDETAER